MIVEATQLENEINHLEQNHIEVDSLRENHKECIKNYRIILRSQQRFGIEKHNVFTEKFNRTALNANNTKRVQSVNSIETCVYGTTKQIIYESEEIKCCNIIKQSKNDSF